MTGVPFIYVVLAAKWQADTGLHQIYSHLFPRFGAKNDRFGVTPAVKCNKRVRKWC